MIYYDFTKMHALGNDFAVFYGNEAELNAISKKIKVWSHRLTGIGFDQLLFIMKQEDNRFFFHIFNADGSQALQCLNGARCVARFLLEKAYTQDKEFSLENAAGTMTVTVPDFAEISLKIPNIAAVSPEKINIDNIDFTKVSVGNDHLITIVKQLNLVDVTTIGHLCQSYFPLGINVGFIELLSDKELLLKTYERGVGETLCCASSTLATAVVGIHQGWLASAVKINFSLGSLWVSLSDDKNYFYLTGSASYCYDGRIKS